MTKEMELEGGARWDEIELPPLTVENIDEDGINNLRIAIILDACKSYNAACHALKRAEEKEDYERALKCVEANAIFFRSRWFHLLTGEDIDGEKIMHTLRYDTPRKWLTLEERKELDELEKRKANEKDDEATESGQGCENRGIRISDGTDPGELRPGNVENRQLADDDAVAVKKSGKRRRKSRTADGRPDTRQLESPDGAEAESIRPRQGRAKTKDRNDFGGGNQTRGFCATVLGSKGQTRNEPDGGAS